MNGSTASAVRARLPDRGTTVVSLFAGIAGVTGSYAVAGFTPSFVAGPVAGALSRHLPAEVVNRGILLLGDAGELLNVAVALVLSTLLFAAIALAGLRAGRALDTRCSALHSPPQ